MKVCSTVAAEAMEIRREKAHANQNTESFMLMKWRIQRNSRIEAFL